MKHCCEEKRFGNLRTAVLYDALSRDQDCGSS